MTYEDSSRLQRDYLSDVLKCASEARHQEEYFLEVRQHLDEDYVWGLFDQYISRRA